MTETYAERRMPQLLTVEDVAATLVVSPRSVLRLIAAGDIQAIRIGQRRLRIEAGEFYGYLERQRTGAAA